MTAKIQTIVAEQGAALSVTLTRTDGDLTGRNLRMHVRSLVGETTTKLVASTSDGRLAVASATTATLLIPSSVMAAVSVTDAREQWVYDVESWTTAEDVRREWQGAFQITRDVTRDTEATTEDALAGLVRYDSPQSLTDDQKTQARDNIGAGTGGGGGSGDVVGPASSTDGRLALFSGTTGKLLAQGSVTGAAVASHLTDTANPHATTAAQVGADPTGTAAAAAAALAATLGTASTHNVPASGNAASGEVVKGSDTRLSDSRTPSAHATSHAPGGSDALPWTTIHGRGVAASRPTAAAGNAGYVYFSTDTLALERSTGSAWESIAAGGGAPGGSATEMQYRVDASTFGGMAGTAWDNTNRSLTLTGATVTANKPLFDLSQTWNNAAVAFTAVKVNVTNTAFADGSLVADFQAGGVSRLCVGSGAYGARMSIGQNYNEGVILRGTLSSSASIADATSGSTGWRADNLFGRLGTDISLNSGVCIQWSPSGPWYNGSDAGIARNAAGVVEVNSGTAGTYRDIKVRNLLAGGGNGSYVQTPSMAVADLASAATAGSGARAFVTDATATTFLSTVAGGGSNKVPVVSDGTNWLIG